MSPMMGRINSRSERVGPAWTARGWPPAAGDDALAFLDEAHRDGDGDPVGRRLVSIEDPVQHGEVVVVLAKSDRAKASRRRSTMPTTSSVSTPRGMMRSDKFGRRPEGLEGAGLQGVE